MCVLNNVYFVLNSFQLHRNIVECCCRHLKRSQASMVAATRALSDPDISSSNFSFFFPKCSFSSSRFNNTAPV